MPLSHSEEDASLNGAPASPPWPTLEYEQPVVAFAASAPTNPIVTRTAKTGSRMSDLSQFFSY
jgi:hypothetical protein